MAVRNGSNNGFKGKVKGTVTYDLNGQSVQRSIGITTKLPTVGQLIAREKMKMINNLLKPVKNLLKFGFKPGAMEKTLNSNNLALRHNLANAIDGAYPDLHINYANALFAKGHIPQVGVKSAVRTESGILFEWEQVPDTKLLRADDQAMLLAYLPEEEDAVYQLGGWLRKEGKGVLTLPAYNKPVVLESYLFFTSANQKMASNSVYTGRIVW